MKFFSHQLKLNSNDDFHIALFYISWRQGANIVNETLTLSSFSLPLSSPRPRLFFPRYYCIYYAKSISVREFQLLEAKLCGWNLEWQIGNNDLQRNIMMLFHCTYAIFYCLRCSGKFNFVMWLFDMHYWQRKPWSCPEKTWFNFVKLESHIRRFVLSHVTMSVCRWRCRLICQLLSLCPISFNQFTLK